MRIINRIADCFALIPASWNWPEVEVQHFPARKGGGKSCDLSINIITTTDPNGRNILKLLDTADRIAGQSRIDYHVTIMEDLKFWPVQEKPDLYRKHLNIHLIRYKETLTQQKALVLGSLLSPKHEAEVVIDPDMHRSLRHIEPAMSRLEKGNRIIHFSRPDRKEGGILRQVASYVYTKLFCFFGRLTIKDANTPMVMYQGKQLSEATARPAGRINPRIYAYITNRSAIHSIQLPETGEPHKSHYKVVPLVRIFIGQIMSTFIIRLFILTNLDK